MPTGSVRLQSIKKLGQENHGYEFSNEGNAASGRIPESDDALLNRDVWPNGRQAVDWFIHLADEN